MEARATRRPGQKGTKKLVQKFGDRLIFVRYRYDTERRRRFTTVELIVDESPWNPRSPISPPVAPNPGRTRRGSDRRERSRPAPQGTGRGARSGFAAPATGRRRGSCAGLRGCQFPFSSGRGVHAIGLPQGIADQVVARGEALERLCRIGEANGIFISYGSDFDAQCEEIPRIALMQDAPLP